ncbi:transglutaminase-like domain-containing protein [Kovacikia minuta CCNUW1]|uniref:SirB1 family protein n=1 Tax=Kovacikia minuta TaxID=2931930 RepID=UPI001CCA5323|nr:transglutaminase-like domain-containing protein [Kovacikia minuta]UBF27259.1 transglutaminase-like domain-containing protein [Kovacikia minuta CCNUW1]
MDFSIARKYFYQEIHQADEQISLEKAALYLAMEEYPDLEVHAYLNALDTMAAEIEDRLPTAPYPLKVLQTINHYLYEDLGFTGNTDAYYDPRNSFLNEVIDRRTGIPITLSLVYLAISQRINFPMVGVGMPGHFLIRPDVEEMEIFVDAFHQGEILFAQDCQELLSQAYGQPIKLHPTFLQAVTPRQFLARMLTNLKMIYLNQGNLQKMVAAVERILLLYPDAAIELRDRGVLYYRLNRFTEARQDLEDYLALMPTAEDAAVIQELLDVIEGKDEG